MKLLFALFYIAFVAEANPVTNELLNRGEKILSEVRDTVQEVNAGSDQDRINTIQWTFDNVDKLQEDVEMGKMEPEMRKKAQENFKNLVNKMENEMKVYEGVFRGHESDPTKETVVKAAKEMVEDAKEQNFAPESQEGQLVESLQERLDSTEKYGFDGRDLFQKMIRLNEITNFYSTPIATARGSRIMSWWAIYGI